jgi:CARDB
MTSLDAPATRAGGVRASVRLAVVTCLVALVSAFVGVQKAVAADVLILDTTVAGGMASLEAQQAISLGLTVDVVNAATWSSLSNAQFASYRAIVLGDPNCVTSAAPLAPAEANRAVWSPAVTGNIILLGTDPAFHRSLASAATLTRNGIAFAAGRADETGLFATLSCYYSGAAVGTAVPVLDRFGGFAVRGQGDSCPNAAHIVSTHPALAGLNDAALSNWDCSTHEAFEVFPGSFEVLTINRDLPTGYTAPDGTVGGPYILAQSALDHFKCYRVREKTKKQDPIVILTDRFGTSRAVVKKAVSLCNPANKNDEGLSDPRAHLTCYAIRDDKRSKPRPGSGRERIMITNQFGEQKLKIRGPETLCVPSSKSLFRQDPGPPPAQLDHFKCYGAKGDKRGPRERVSLVDQFGKSRVKVGRVELFCTPVSKNDEGIMRPESSLVCYGIHPRDRVGRTVIVRNQFGLAFLRVKKSETLCIPSREQERPLPDLVVALPNPTGVVCSGVPVTCISTVRFVISNAGAAPVPAGSTFQVLLQADPALAVTKTVSVTLSSALGPGGSLPAQAEMMPPSGNCYDPDCTVTARVDSTNAIVESNEGNNGATRTDLG